MNTLFGAGLLGYGIYLVVFAMNTTADVGIALWGKAALAVLVGLIVVAWNSVDFVRGLWNKYKNNQPLIETDKPVAGISIMEEQHKDVETLFYLTERVKSSPEGLEYCRKLNDLIFSIHHNKEEK